MADERQAVSVATAPSQLRPLLESYALQRLPCLADQSNPRHGSRTVQRALSAAARRALSPRQDADGRGDAHLDALARAGVAAVRLACAYADVDDVLVEYRSSGGSVSSSGGSPDAAERTALARLRLRKDDGDDDGGGGGKAARASVSVGEVEAQLRHLVGATPQMRPDEVRRACGEAGVLLDDDVADDTPALVCLAAAATAAADDARGAPRAPGNSALLHLDWPPTQLSLAYDTALMGRGAARVFLAQLDAMLPQLLRDPSAAFLASASAASSVPLPPSPPSPPARGADAGADADADAEADVDAELMSAHATPSGGVEAHLPLRWLEERATSRPDAIAHEFYDEPPDDDDGGEDDDGAGAARMRTMTYGELDARSNQLAAWLLRRRGLRLEDRVAVCRPRDEGFYVGQAGLTKAGGCYVPIDVDLPAERKAFIAKDSGARLVLTDADHVAKDIFEGVEAVDFFDPDFQRQLDALDASERVSKGELDGLSYILYTSGTTGKPKGCLQTHRNLFWAITVMSELPLPITEPDRDKRLAMAAVAFDVHVSEIVQSWRLGVRLVSVRSRLSLLADLQGSIERIGITHVGMVPSMIEATLTKPPEQLPIKYMVSGGEKCSDAVLLRWASHPGVVFANFYGPTEVTIGCTYRRVRGVEERRDNIGHPFTANAAYVVDADMNILPRGCPGELVMEGPLVGRGYLNLPEATKKSFLEWPRKGCRAYRTGDLVRMHHDGSILISGRIDSQIKLRGVRIESEGVSAVLRNAVDSPPLDAVSVVATHPSTADSELLVSFVAPNDGSVSANERRKPPSFRRLPGDVMDRLRAASNKELASYMRPSHIVPCAFLPLSHNGKVDAKPLKALFVETDMDELMVLQGTAKSARGRARGDADEGREPTEAEREVVRLIAQVARVDASRLRPHQSLLGTGLGSLDVARLTARINEAKGLRLSVSDVFGAETLEGCASLMQERHSEGTKSASSAGLDLAAFQEQHRGGVEAAGFSWAGVERLLPPLPVQPGVVFQISQSPERYVQHFVYGLPAAVGADRIEKALAAACEALPILRTAFHADAESGELVQVVLKSWSALPVVRLETDIEEPGRMREHFDANLAADVARRINSDLTTPMWAAHVFKERRSDDARFVCLSLNHAVYDHFAVVSLMRGLDAVLAGEEDGKVWDRRVGAAEALAAIGDVRADSHRRFWTEFLSPAKSASTSPRLAPRQASDAGRRHERRFELRLSDVKRGAASRRATMQALVNAAFALAACEVLGWRDKAVVFANVRDGRSLPLAGVENAVCPLVTLVPTLLHVGSARDADELCARAQAGVVRTAAHEHVPLGLIQQWIGVRDLVQVALSCRYAGMSEYRVLRRVPGAAPAPEFPLAIEVLLDDEADSLVAKANAATAMPQGQVEQLLQAFEKGLAQIVTDSPEVLRASRPQSLVVDDGDRDSSPNESEEGAVTPPNVSDEAMAQVLSLLAAFFASPGKEDQQPSVRPTTSLMSLGLTSLRAVALSRRLAKAGVHVGALDILQADTPLGVAAAASFEAHGKAAAADGAPALAGQSRVTGQVAAPDADDMGQVPMPPDVEAAALAFDGADRPVLAPTTSLQAGMLAQTVATEGRLYVHAFVLELEPDVDVGKLREAWRLAQRDLEVLRTTFHFSDATGEWVQAVHSFQSVRLPWSEGEVGLDGAVRSVARDAVQKLSLTSPESLASRPPWALALGAAPTTTTKTTQDGTANPRRRMVLAMHHSLYDGASLDSLLAHVARIYRGEAAAEPPPSFLSVARRIRASEAEAADYFCERLRDAPSRFLPTRTGRGGADDEDRHADDHDGRVRSCRASRLLSRAQSERVVDAARQGRVTVQSFAQLALARSLAGRARTVDVVFCQVLSGRTMRGADDVVGPTFNTVPVRVRLASSRRLRDALRGLHAENLERLRWQHAPLRAVQQGVGRAPLSDVLFLYQPRIEPSSTGSSRPWRLAKADEGEEGEGEPSDGSTQFGLNVELREAGDGSLGLFASASRAVLGREELAELLAELLDDMAAIAEKPDGASVEPELEGRRDESAAQRAGDGETAEARLDETQLRGRRGEVLKLLSQVLKTKDHGEWVQRLRPTTSLAALGLDSITAIQLSSRARRQGVQLKPSKVVRCETVADLLSLVDGGDGAKRAETATAAEVERPRLAADVAERVRASLDAELREGTEVLPSTAGMELLFGGWQRSRGRGFHIVVGRRASSGQGRRLDGERLERAWRDLVRRHAILRSFVVPVPPRADVPAAPRVPRTALCVVSAERWRPSFELKTLADGKDEEEEHAAVQAVGQDLLLNQPSMRKPGARLVLVRGAHSDSVLLNLPHVNYDGQSLPMLLRDLESLYLGRAPTSSADLESFVAASVGDGATAQRREAFWRDHLGGGKADGADGAKSRWTPSTWPSAPSKLLRPSPAVVVDDARLDAALLAQRARSWGTSLGALLAGAWSVAQAERVPAGGGGRRATFGFLDAGRTVELAAGGARGATSETLAAPTINTVPLDVDVGAAPAGGAAADGEAAGAARVRAASRAVQAGLRGVPEWATQTKLADVARWTGLGEGEPPINVWMNLMLGGAPGGGDDDSDGETSGQSGGDAASSSPSSPLWEPLPISHKLTAEQQQRLEASVDLMLGAGGEVAVPEAKIDLDLVARVVETAPAAQPSGKVGSAVAAEARNVRLAATAAEGFLDEAYVQALLRRWAELLYQSLVGRA